MGSFGSIWEFVRVARSALVLHQSRFQVGHPAHHTDRVCATGITLGLIAMHQLHSLREWLDSREGRRCTLASGCLLRDCTALGQYAFHDSDHSEANPTNEPSSGRSAVGEFDSSGEPLSVILVFGP